MKRNKNRKSPPIDSFVGSDSILEGSIRSEDSVRVDGSLSGQIEAGGELVVGRPGRVKADIKAGSVTVAGHVVGNITADHRLEISEAGLLVGDLEAPNISVAEGGVVEGFCKMVGEGVGENTPPGPVISHQELRNFDQGSDFESTERQGKSQNVTSRRLRIFHALAFVVFLVISITLLVSGTYFDEPSQDLQSKQLRALVEPPVARSDNEPEGEVSLTPKAQIEFVKEAPERSSRFMQRGEGEAQLEGLSAGRGSKTPPASLDDASRASYAKIENQTVEYYGEEGEAFRLKFKLVNPPIK